MTYSRGLRAESVRPCPGGRPLSVRDRMLTSGIVSGAFSRSVIRLLALVLAALTCRPAAGLSADNVGGWLLKFAGAPTRFVGTPGHRAALDAVEQTLRAVGARDVRRESFRIVVPVSEAVWITGPGLGRMNLDALWPNHVQVPATPSGGITGPLVDAGHGEASALDGNAVEGAIALVRLPSAENPQGWLTPFVLGARAVIFLPPEGGGFTRAEAEELFLDVPADLPRFWAPSPSVPALLEAARRRVSVTLVSRVAWREITTENVWGVLPGSEERFPSVDSKTRTPWKDKRVILQAYTDAMSVVPERAPGAEEAGGLIALMELARHFSVLPVPPTLCFLATSGHGHVLSGSHDFLARHIRRDAYFSRSITAGEKLAVNYFIGLDLTSGDERVASFAQGTLYTGWETNLLSQNALAGVARLLDGHAVKLWGKGAPGRYLNGVSPPTRAWKDLLGYRAAFDAEAATFTGTAGMTFATPFDSRGRCDTPLDTADRVNVAALSRQIETLKALLSAAFRDPGFFSEMKLELPDFGRALNGEVHEFERTVTGLPSKPVAQALMTIRSGTGGKKTYGPVRGLHVFMSRKDDPATLTRSETGTFRVPIVRIREYWKWVGFTVEGYLLDTGGSIVLSPDMGPITAGQFGTSIAFQEREKGTIQVLCRTRPLTILEPVDARQLRFLDSLTVMDGMDQPFMNYGWSIVGGQSLAQEDYTPAVVIFAPATDPGAAPARMKALLSTGPFGLKGIFTGADESLLDRGDKGMLLEEAQGRGYPVTLGVLRRAPFEGAKDMWLLDEARGRLLKKHNVRNFRIELLHERARAALEEARGCLKARRYADFLSASRRAWGLEARAYPEFKGVANDLVKTVVFYCLLLLPFAFCMERLMFAFADLRYQIAATAAFFLLGFLALRQVHPAFQISSNPLIIFLAFIVLALGIMVLGIISTKFQRELKRMKGERGDYDSVDIGRVSATMAALTLGLSNLRRRPVRTALTVVTVVVLTFTVLSMVSMSSTISFFRLPRGMNPPYSGALIRETQWQVLQPPVESYARSALTGAARIVPRSWVTARRRDEALQLELTAGGRTAMVSALLGLSPEESFVLNPASRAGLTGRWFREGDRFVCLLPRVVAARLGVSVGGRVSVRGYALQVIGVYDGGKLLDVRDLDGEALTPAKFSVRRGRYDWEEDTEPKPTERPSESFQTTEHLSGDAIAIVPHALAMSMEGRVRSIAVVPRAGVGTDDLGARIREFLTRTAVIALVSDGSRVQLLTSVGAVSVQGAFDLLLPLVLVGLIVLNTMMGSVHERVKEIAIFSSVGLAPVHIGALFVAEAFVVAIVGVVLGYLLAQTVAAVLLSSGTLAGLSLNYSSSAAVGACLIVITAVMLSTIYPAKRASALAVPDVTRRWILPQPQGDRLEFDFPFTVGKADLVGMFAYLADLFRAYRDSSIGSFATDHVVLSRTDQGVAITFTCWLAPYDLGISQDVRMETIPMEVPGLNRIRVSLIRRSGEAVSWHRQNRSFLTALRKRFLVWRMFGADRKARYARQGEEQMHERIKEVAGG